MSPIKTNLECLDDEENDFLGEALEHYRQHVIYCGDQTGAYTVDSDLYKKLKALEATKQAALKLIENCWSNIHDSYRLIDLIAEFRENKKAKD